MIGRVVLLFSFLVSLTACSGSNIDIVKNGVLNFDKSVSIGDALDKSVLFSATEWIEKTDSQGRNYVIFKGKFRDFYNKEVTAWLKHSKFAQENVRYYDSVVIQFLLSKDATQFEIVAVTAYVPNKPDEWGINFVKNLYSNNINYFKDNSVIREFAKYDLGLGEFVSGNNNSLIVKSLMNDSLEIISKKQGITKRFTGTYVGRGRIEYQKENGKKNFLTFSFRGDSSDSNAIYSSVLFENEGYTRKRILPSYLDS